MSLANDSGMKLTSSEILKVKFEIHWQITDKTWELPLESTV